MAGLGGEGLIDDVFGVGAFCISRVEFDERRGIVCVFLFGKRE